MFYFYLYLEEVLKSRWKGLRDTFRKEYKKPGDSKWIHYKNLTFLEDVMFDTAPPKSALPISNDDSVSSDKKSNDKIKKDSDSVKDVVYFCDDNTNEEISNDEIDLGDFTPTELLTTEMEQVDGDSDINIVNLNSRTGVNSDCTDSEVGDSKIIPNDQLINQAIDDDYHFFMSLIPHVKSLPPDQKLLLRMKMQEIIYNEVKSLN